MPMSIEFEGFNDLIKKIEKAGGSIHRTSKTCMQLSARIMDTELRNGMAKAGVDPDIIAEMPAPTVEVDHGLITAKVGYKKGAFNPDDLTTGYKVVFYNYGTPHRTEHGKMPRKNFIVKAKRRAKRKIKKQEEEALHKILKGL